MIEVSAFSNLNPTVASPGYPPAGNALAHFEQAAGAAGSAVADFRYLPALLGVFILIAGGYLLLHRISRKKPQ